MSVEFRCHVCGKLLRTADANAGRPASCPACGEALVVPEPMTQGVPHRMDNVASGRSEADDYAVPTEFEPPAHSADLPATGFAPEPHRGGMILSFGLLSWTVCFFFGFPAWFLGAADLRAMRAGRMDREGEAMTRAGMYLGLGNVLLSAAVVIVVIVGGLVALAMSQR